MPSLRSDRAIVPRLPDSSPAAARPAGRSIRRCRRRRRWLRSSATAIRRNRELRRPPPAAAPAVRPRPPRAAPLGSSAGLASTPSSRSWLRLEVPLEKSIVQLLGLRILLLSGNQPLGQILERPIDL